MGAAVGNLHGSAESGYTGTGANGWCADERGGSRDDRLLVRAVAHAQAEQQKASPSAGAETLRFADYFKPWSEYKAPDPSDIALFREAVKDAAPLQKSNRADTSRPKPKPHANHHEADELAALEASQLAMYPSPMSWDIGADIEDEQSFLRGAVSPDLLRKLRRGQWTIDAEIDLHHHTQDVFLADQTTVKHRQTGGRHHQHERGGHQHPGRVGTTECRLGIDWSSGNRRSDGCHWFTFSKRQSTTQ